MTPEQARARARAILDRQVGTQVVTLGSDGSVQDHDELAQGKKIVLHDPLGEYARGRGGPR